MCARQYLFFIIILGVLQVTEHLWYIKSPSLLDEEGLSCLFDGIRKGGRRTIAKKTSESIPRSLFFIYFLIRHWYELQWEGKEVRLKETEQRVEI